MNGEAYTKIFRKLLSRRLSKKLPSLIKIIEVSRRDSRRFSLRYFKKEKPANVLSFFYSPRYGEILICPEVIRRDAKKLGYTYKYQVTWMILHGMIHLAGLHHEGSRQAAKRVECLEAEILERLVGHNSKFKNKNSK